MPSAHVEAAYWETIKDLVAPVDIPIPLLKAALPEFLTSTGSSSQAGDVLIKALDGIAWDWPAWHDFAKKSGRESLPNIAISIAKMRPAEVLKSLSVAELKQLCQEHQAIPPTRPTKEQTVGALLKSVGKESIQEVIQPFRQQLQEKHSVKCREQMALHLASRITLIAYHMHHYEQTQSLPVWRFVWGGATDIDAPKGCRKFNNKRLSISQAKQDFPVLPCDYLHCGCYVVGESGKL